MTYRLIRLTANPDEINKIYLPIVVGSVRIYNKNRELVAISLHRRIDDPEGVQSFWGDIVSPDKSIKYGEVYYGSNISLIGRVLVEESLFEDNDNVLYFRYSVRQFNAKYFPTPHIRVNLETEGNFDESQVGIRLKSAKNLVEFLRPAHIVVEITFKNKLEDNLEEEVVDELYTIRKIVLDDYPFRIWAKTGILFDRKDYGEDNNDRHSGYQYPATRSGDDYVGIVIDTMNGEDFPEESHGGNLRIKALFEDKFDIYESIGLEKVTGILLGRNYTEVISSKEEPFVFEENCLVLIGIGRNKGLSVVYSCEIPAETYSAQELAEYLRTNLTQVDNCSYVEVKCKDSIDTQFYFEGEACNVFGFKQNIWYKEVISFEKPYFVFPTGINVLKVKVDELPKKEEIVFEENIALTYDDIIDEFNAVSGNYLIIKSINIDVKFCVNDGALIGACAVLGITPTGTNKIRLIYGVNYEPFDFGAEKILELKVYYGSDETIINVSLTGIMTGEDVVSAILNAMGENTASWFEVKASGLNKYIEMMGANIIQKLRGHHPQHLRCGQGGNIRIKSINPNVEFKITGNALEKLGLEEYNDIWITEAVGNKYEFFTFIGGYLPERLYIQVKYEDIIYDQKMIWFVYGVELLAEEVVLLIQDQLPPEGKAWLEVSVLGREPLELANVYENLQIYAGSPLDEEFTLMLRRNGGLYGAGVVTDKDIEYLYRGVNTNHLPNKRDGISYLRGRLIIEEIL